MATKETTVCVAPMHLIFPYTYLDNRDSRLHNICVTSDKLVFFLSFCDIFFFLKIMLFSVTKMITLSTQTVLSQPTLPKK